MPFPQGADVVRAVVQRVACTACGTLIPVSARACPYCGYRIQFSSKPIWAVLILILIVVGLIFVL